jgi:protoporphyrinogen oxidase
MKIGIIGAGFTGLTAGLRLTKKGHDVVILEAGKRVGGLAGGFKEKGWNWELDYHYHHWFSSDSNIKKLAKEVKHDIFFKRPKTSTLYKGGIFQLDSPLSLLRFPHLSLFDRLRTGLVLAYLRYYPDWKPLEKMTSKQFLTLSMGKKSWEVLWEPLFKNKFGKFAEAIPASWFWARIKKRTPSLGYPVGGFQEFADSIGSQVKKHGGEITCDVVVEKIIRSERKISIVTSGKIFSFDKVICTLPTPVFTSIAKELPQSYKKNLKSLVGIGAATLVASLNEGFFDDGTYWLNINENNFPFLALVEHTNLVDKKHYKNEHLLYVANYLPEEHKYFSMSAKQLMDKFFPYLKRINPKFKKSTIKKSWVFKTPFAQPIFPLNYSKHIPPFKTPVEGLYLANMQQIFPWDRGTEFAVDIGNKVAILVDSHK